ncbi:hypothetical protein PVA45_01930 [Entomospira entomophila]|uniref:Pallilysin beta barrel domain-containing protein n=1 Tax=Entomospira entomophila TaxID=2719988 RepID=A0A968G7Z9_9SPIO|nr:hypothetical protein [Entomospira entomophilus]NIZ40272.1 hypothetical protein [Entomospira entomophilus]WDI35831.1 hypothetical protein PVA45_01930 [Entomospira entomophilus]
MQYRIYTILLATLLLLTSCRNYKEFDSSIFDKSPIKQEELDDTKNHLKPILSHLAGENSAYWTTQEQGTVLIYPYLWNEQEQSIGHTLQLNSKTNIIHAPFHQATLDYIPFDPEDDFPFALLKIENPHLLTETLEIYQLKSNVPTLLFHITVTGQIHYILDKDNTSANQILIQTPDLHTETYDYYRYDPSQKQFILAQSESHSYNKGLNRSQDIESFLAGPWQSDTAIHQGMIVFMPQERQILFEQERVEIYDWISTSSYNGKLNIQAKNLQITRISGNTTITVIDANTINVQSLSNSVWQGQYKRVNLQQEQVNRQGPASIVLQNAPFHGVYLDQSGVQLDFDYPLFSKKTLTSNKQSGSMSLFMLENIMIMQLRYRNIYGIIEEQESFEVSFTEESDGIHHIRLLQLKPTRLFIFGSYPLPQSVIQRYEQIERVSS